MFEVPSGADEIRIVSRSVVPASIDPTVADERRLGVSLVGLTLRSERLEITLRPEDPALVTGFYPAEPGHRWTDGRALLPQALYAAFVDGFTIEIELVPSALRYPLP